MNLAHDHCRERALERSSSLRSRIRFVSRSTVAPARQGLRQLGQLRRRNLQQHRAGQRLETKCVTAFSLAAFFAGQFARHGVGA